MWVGTDFLQQNLWCQTMNFRKMVWLWVVIDKFVHLCGNIWVVYYLFFDQSDCAIKTMPCPQNNLSRHNECVIKIAGLCIYVFFKVCLPMMLRWVSILSLRGLWVVKAIEKNTCQNSDFPIWENKRTNSVNKFRLLRQETRQESPGDHCPLHCCLPSTCHVHFWRLDFSQVTWASGGFPFALPCLVI